MKYVLYVILVLAIGYGLLYWNASKYDKSKKKVQKHIDNGDIIEADLSA